MPSFSLGKGRNIEGMVTGRKWNGQLRELGDLRNMSAVLTQLKKTGVLLPKFDAPNGGSGRGASTYVVEGSELWQNASPRDDRMQRLLKRGISHLLGVSSRNFLASGFRGG